MKQVKDLCLGSKVYKAEIKNMAGAAIADVF